MSSSWEQQLVQHTLLSVDCVGLFVNIVCTKWWSSNFEYNTILYCITIHYDYNSIKVKMSSNIIMRPAFLSDRG